jgi:hypothetical protein
VGQACFYLYQFDWFTGSSENRGFSPFDVYNWTMQNDKDRVDPLIQYFPCSMGCDIELYGPSGTVQFQDFLCTSTYNIANERIHIVAFILMTILALSICLNFLYTWGVMGFLLSNHFNDKKHYNVMCSMTDSQKLFLLLISKNVGADIWQALLDQLAASNSNNKKKRGPKSRKHPKISKEEKKRKLVSQRGNDLSKLPI